MHRIVVVLLTATAASLSALQAQTLDVQPAWFADPRPGNSARHGEVVLGQTTVGGARRMFAELLSSDSIKVSLGHPGNPAPTRPGTVWEVAGHRVYPRQRLDLGPDRYALYFDQHDRLIAALTQQMPGKMTREQLAAHYPSLQRGRRWYSGDQPVSDTWTAALGPCVTLTASVLIPDGRVERLSYVYTCSTTSRTATGSPAQSTD